MPDRLRDATFATFDLSLNPAMRPAVAACMAVARGDAWCAALLGDPGLGKSHLAAAALVGRPGRFWEWGALLRNLRHLCFDEGGPQVPEGEALKAWQEYRPLLVFDDVGAEKVTEWAAQTLYAVVNARYSARLPTILTSNNPAAIDERCLSRLWEGAVACEGRDVRKLRPG